MQNFEEIKLESSAILPKKIKTKWSQVPEHFIHFLPTLGNFEPMI